MGRSLPPSATAGLKNIARVISSDRIRNAPKQAKPISNYNNNSNTNNKNNKVSQARVDSVKLGLKLESNNNSGATQCKVPLSEVVSDCVKRWFHDTLKEAKHGDFSMQLLVGQMYNSGYGVRRDFEKGRAWITRASKGRASAWKVSNKQPGYNASDSESEDTVDPRS